LVFDIVLDNPTDQTLYATAEAGPFRLDPDTGLWESILGTEAPLTTYWCLESVPELNTIRYGTYGRGIWDYEIPNPASAGELPPLALGSTLSIYPNPASSSARFAIYLAHAGEVTVELFDVTGRRVSTLLEGGRSAGHYEVAYDLRSESGAPLANGVYLARMATEEEVEVEKLKVVR